MSKREKLENKLKEAKIRAEMEELEKSKPTKESFEPDHHRDINQAMETLGDYKLKSSQTYNVSSSLSAWRCLTIVVCRCQRRSG